MKPKSRVTAAKWLLFGSIAGGFINILAYRPLGLIDEITLLLVNLILSWLALALMALDILITADVRRHQ
jgi:hypothetical protein